MTRQLRIDITSEANEYLRELAGELVEEVKNQLTVRKRYYTISEVCEEFSCSRNTLNFWTREYGLKRVLIGNKVYFDIVDLHDLFSQFKK